MPRDYINKPFDPQRFIDRGFSPEASVRIVAKLEASGLAALLKQADLENDREKLISLTLLQMACVISQMHQHPLGRAIFDGQLDALQNMMVCIEWELPTYFPEGPHDKKPAFAWAETIRKDADEFEAFMEAEIALQEFPKENMQ